MNRYFLTKTGYMIILVIPVIFYFTGCEQPSEPDDPVNDQGVGLESIAQSSKQSLGNQFNSLRITLLLLSTDLQDADLSGLETYQRLMDVTNHSSDRIHGSGIVDWHGIVQNGYPSFVQGEDRSTDPGIVNAFATTDHFPCQRLVGTQCRDRKISMIVFTSITSPPSWRQTLHKGSFTSPAILIH